MSSDETDYIKENESLIKDFKGLSYLSIGRYNSWTDEQIKEYKEKYKLEKEKNGRK